MVPLTTSVALKDMPRHCLDMSRHFQDISRQCLDILTFSRHI